MVSKMVGKSKELSKGLLQMKFMQRSVIKKEQDKKAEKASTSQEASENEAKGGIKYELRYEVLQKLSYGRLSFQEFNPEVEKLMKFYRDLEENAEPNIIEDVSAQEFAETHSSVSSTIAKRFTKKRDRKASDDEETSNEPPMKRKFLKPK